MKKMQLQSEWLEKESSNLTNVILDEMMERRLTIEVLEEATERIKEAFRGNGMLPRRPAGYQPCSSHDGNCGNTNSNHQNQSVEYNIELTMTGLENVEKKVEKIQELYDEILALAGELQSLTVLVEPIVVQADEE